MEEKQLGQVGHRVIFENERVRIWPTWSSSWSARCVREAWAAKPLNDVRGEVRCYLS